MIMIMISSLYNTFGYCYRDVLIAGLNSRLSGSASNLSFVGKSSAMASPRSGLGTGLAGQKNGFMAKSWSNLSSPSKSSVGSSPSGELYVDYMWVHDTHQSTQSTSVSDLGVLIDSYFLIRSTFTSVILIFSLKLQKKLKKLILKFI